MDNKRTEISELGEFGLIDHLTKDLKPQNSSTLYGVGDDCAVLDYSGQDKEVLVTTDMLMEGVHFDLTYVPLKHLGYKSAMVNISDIYAMNACQRHGVDLVGGDTTSSLTGLAISITCIGEAEKGKAVYRNGAGQNDLICVSGNLGAAYMGLQLLEREKAVFNSTPHDASEPFNPDFAGKEYLLERQLKPEARGDIIKELREAGIQPTAMMDISDGLSSELIHICKQSNTGCSVYQERIPIDYQTAVMAEELNMDVYTCALNGGEDYELLFTVPLTDHDKVIQLKDVKLIGHMTRPELGRHLVTKSGQEVELKAQGWTSNL